MGKKIISSLGEDYNNKKLPRVSSDLTFNVQRIAYFNGLMKLYVDDVLVVKIKDQRIHLPIAYNYRVKVGDFSSLRRGWEGSISFFSVSLVSTFSNKI